MRLLKLRVEVEETDTEYYQSQDHNNYTQVAQTVANNEYSSPRLPIADYDDQSKYTVESDDNLSQIAEKHYGDQTQWTKIYEANQEIIGDDPNLIHADQELVIPEI